MSTNSINLSERHKSMGQNISDKDIIANVDYVMKSLPQNVVSTTQSSDELKVQNVKITRTDNLITMEQMQKMWPGVETSKMKPIMDELNANLTEYKLDTPNRKAHFMGQVRQEIGPDFVLIEDLARYTSKNLKDNFGYYSKHPNEAETDAKITPNSLKEATIANNAYMDKNRSEKAALGNIEIGDGYKFIGRGLKQTTGRYNYEVMNKIYPKVWSDEKINFLETPELLEQPKYAARSAVVFWLDKKLYISADKGVNGKYIDEVSTVINRYDTPSFSRRRGFVQEAAKIFK